LREHRIFVGWPDGYFITSADLEFRKGLQEMVRDLGPPTIVEFRSYDEGYLEEIEKPDSTAVRWVARLAYCAMAPFVLVGGLITDLHSFLLRVADNVHDAFGGIDSAVPELAAGVLTAIIVIGTTIAISLVLFVP